MKRVLVTGSTRGIGRATAVALARAGYDVTLHGRAPSSRADEAAGEVGSASGRRPQTLFFDVASLDEAARATGDDVAANGAYYGVVCSAGVAADAPFPGMSFAAWDTVIRTNLYGFFHVVRPLVMPMIRLRAGGRIVVVTSVSGVAGNRGQVNYSASKAALGGAVRSLAKELASRGITVNCVAPGAVDTDMVTGELRERLVKEIPAGRLCRPEEVAGAVTYLMGENAGYVTGHTLVMSGGLV